MGLHEICLITCNLRDFDFVWLLNLACYVSLYTWLFSLQCWICLEEKVWSIKTFVWDTDESIGPTLKWNQAFEVLFEWQNSACNLLPLDLITPEACLTQFFAHSLFNRKEEVA